MPFKILHYESVDSTNQVARALAEKGMEEGVVVQSSFQTHGRGRFHRRWRSPKGKDLLFSIILRPVLKQHQVSILTQVAARAVRHVLRETFELPAVIKKPNDILVQGKKICGILTEASSFPSGVRYVIVGIGLNVNAKRSEMIRRATSICEGVKKPVDLNELLDLILSQFAVCYRELIPDTGKKLRVKSLAGDRAG